MLYEKSKGVISEELFKNPPCEFRGAPFWAWNGKLDKDEVVWQAGIFKEMGFGGYHIHVRTGLEDEYLGEKFNECVKACAEDAEKTKMLAWLYDEDRWPSGFAGGFVTKDKAFRQRYLQFQRKKDKSKPVYNEEGVLIGGAEFPEICRILYFSVSCASAAERASLIAFAPREPPIKRTTGLFSF